MTRPFYLVAGVFSGVMIGGMLAIGICMNLERLAGIHFGKGPFLEIMAGVFLGGILGGIVGLKQVPKAR
ncbi:hypothetical protein BH11PLA2_BH11PLA2_13640 [soil metagenome]